MFLVIAVTVVVYGLTARSLAVRLGVDPRTVGVLPSPLSDGRELASVQSPPLMERLREMMNASDNVMAESIGREVAGHNLLILTLNAQNFLCLGAAMLHPSMAALSQPVTPGLTT